MFLVLSREDVMEVVAGKCDLRAVDFDEALIVEVEG